MDLNNHEGELMTLHQFLNKAQKYNLSTVEEALWIIFPGDEVLNELDKYPTIAPFTPIDAAIEELKFRKGK